MSEPREKAKRQRRIAWVTILLEGVLFSVAVLIFARYWIMLPIKYRIAGLTGLSIVALIGLIRIALLLKRR